jgi:tRNA-splicing ligase RtcB
MCSTIEKEQGRVMSVKSHVPFEIYGEAFEQGALDQFQSALDSGIVVQAALMPDAHAGYSLPIGAVAATKDFVVPAWVGYDIGCGMSALPLSTKKQNLITNSEKIFQNIYRDVPTGFGQNKDATENEDTARLELMDCSPQMKEIREKKLWKNQLGSLGSGNHFIEIGADEDDNVWIIIHSGSRGVGHACATHYMKAASGTEKPLEGHHALHIQSDIGKDYIRDLNWSLEFALANRKEMIARVADVIKRHAGGEGDWTRLINRNHNHAELRDGLWIHRKGATQAEQGMTGVIPGNMRDGSFIVRGKGNPGSLYSSSHGAGRVLGRRQAMETLDVKAFENTMKGIRGKIGRETLDESPFAYKNIFDVMKMQQELVEVMHHVRPLINVKGVTETRGKKDKLKSKERRQEDKEVIRQALIDNDCS